MYISAFHLDGFGIFTNVDCQNLSKGLNIFYGANEAGKSTCLDFFRVMLTGYPEKNVRQRRSYEPVNGGHPGGSLVLHCEEKPYEIRIVRSPAAAGGLRIYAADGSALHGDMLAKVMGGVDGDVYRRVFGFGLEELERWDKKSDESIRRALYGASFGPGLMPPGQVADKLEKRMAKIYRARGNQQPLTEALYELEKLKIEIQKWQNDCTGYDELAQELAASTQRLGELATQRGELEQERRNLERKLGQWQNWEQWRSLDLKIAKLEQVPEGFPEDAVARLAALQATTANAAGNLASAQSRLESSEIRAAAIHVNALLLSDLPELKRLAERKSSYRQALGQIRNLEENLRASEDDLATELAQLGPGWDCERIRKTDRSLFARDGMEKQAARLGDARLAHQTASANLASANNEVESAASAIADAEAEMEALPDPVAILNDNERDELRNNMARLEESRRNEPVRKQAMENASHAFQRALQQAQIFGDGDAEDEVSHILANLARRQNEAIAQANEMQRCLDSASEVRQQLEKTTKEAEELKSRIDDMKAAQRAAGGPSREALEGKTAALRSLRTLAANMENEQERKKELDARINLEKTPPQIKNWTLIIFSLLFLAGAVTIFIAHWFFGLQELMITPEAKIPLNLWAAYAALLCGVVLFAGGFSAHGPEQRRHKQEFALLLSRSEACSVRIAELAAQARQLCQTAGLESLDPIALDAMEMLLEREKEQLFHEERSRQEIENLKNQLDSMHAAIGAQQQSLQEREDAVQHCRKRWHGLMQSLNITNVPSPESMATVFARAEAARIAEVNLINARKELDSLWEDLHLLEETITKMPAIREKLEAAAEPLSLEEAVKQALDSCREADMIKDRRIRLQEEIEKSKNGLVKAQMRQRAASDQFDEAGRLLETAQSEWSICVGQLGLGSDLNPETAREAYKCMQACLSAEERVVALKRDLAQAREEITALEEVLHKLLLKFEEEPQLGADNKPDWLATLDKLLAEAEANARLSDRLDSLENAIVEQKDDLTALKAALAAAQSAERNFMQAGKANSADEFLRLAHMRDERRNLKDRRQDLELILERGAQDAPLEQFLASFNSGDRDADEYRLREIQEALDAIGKEEREASGVEALLRQRASDLAAAAEPGELRQKEQMLRESVRRMAREWSELALAEGLLAEARGIFEKERQPRLIQAASEIFSEITAGRWKGMSLNLEDSSLAMISAQGEYVAPVNLSRGAQEQAYLALRLAYIKKHGEESEPLPVMMDEILVNFDPERARRTAAALAQLTESGRQQFLYFTCQPRIVELLQEMFADSSLYTLEDCTIAAA